MNDIAIVDFIIDIQEMSNQLRNVFRTLGQVLPVGNNALEGQGSARRAVTPVRRSREDDGERRRRSMERGKDF